MVRVASMAIPADPGEIIDTSPLVISAFRAGYLPKAPARDLPAHVASLLLTERIFSEAGYRDLPVPLREPSGRPFFPGKPDFNITHTASRAFAALLLSAPDGARVGIDAEDFSGRGEAERARICRRWFTESERKLYESDPDEKTFLKIWTGKEAIVKQSGVGLAGLRSADSTAPPPGLALTVFPYPGGLLTVCAPEGEAVRADFSDLPEISP